MCPRIWAYPRLRRGPGFPLQFLGFTSRQSAKKVRVNGGPGGLGPPGGGVAGVEPPLRGVPEAVGCRQGGDFPPPEYASHFLC
jgi:hypothetical protein